MIGTVAISRRRFLGTVALGGAAWALGFPRRLAWAVEGGDAGALKLVFFTDVHTRTEWNTPLALEKAVAAINARKPDLVIGGGDFITDGFQSSEETVEPRWEAYLKMHKAIEAAVHPVIGNHDLVAAIPDDGTPPAADPRAVFRRKLGFEQTYRSFDAAGYYFVLLDSIEVTGGDLQYEGRIGPGQMEWLKSDLADRPPETPIVLATHMPLLTPYFEATLGATTPAPRNRVIVNNVDVLGLFEGRNLVLVLQGHTHVNDMIRWRDTLFITGGAVCGQWWRGPWHGTEEGFGVVTLRGNQAEWEYVDYGWDALRPPGE